MKKLTFSSKMLMMVILVITFPINAWSQTQTAGQKAAYLIKWEKVDCFELNRGTGVLRWLSDNFNSWFLVGDVIKAKEGADCNSASLVIGESEDDNGSSRVSWSGPAGKELKNFLVVFPKSNNIGFWKALVQNFSEVFRLGNAASSKGESGDCNLNEQYLVASSSNIYIPSSCFLKTDLKTEVNFGDRTLKLNPSQNGYLTLTTEMTAGNSYELKILGSDKKFTRTITITAFSSIEDIAKTGEVKGVKDSGKLKLEAYRQFMQP